MIAAAGEREREQAVGSMLAAMARRGPDAEGVESWPGATFGHRRLSIFDLSPAGRQPMLNADRSVGVVFNGAIYNFKELREELTRSGFEFRTRTDTEILLHGYRKWGIDELIQRLRGMFAVGLWDAEQRQLFLFRDRLGVKPLLYQVQGDSLAFASTARALRQAGRTGPVDPQAVGEYLEFGYVTDERCIYEGVAKVAAGEVLSFREGQITGRRSYWTVPKVADRPVSFGEAVEETERLIKEAVRLRLEADVRVGALLSAGIDSSLVCWAMAEQGADVTAFTVSTVGDEFDEAPAAQATARQLGIRHEIIPLTADEGQAGWGDLIAAYGEPFACSSALGMLRVSEAVRRSATVLLTGDGGDDVYLGYPEHGHFWRAQKLAAVLAPTLGPRWRTMRSVLPQSGLVKRAANFIGYATGGLGAVTEAHAGLNQYRQEGWLGPRLREIHLPLQESAWTANSARQVLEDFLDYEHRTRFTGEYMTKVDGGAMHWALEARAPFLDHVLWEFAATLPFSLRLQGGQLKAILREVARRRLGEAVSTRKKQGFSIPTTRWLTERWWPQVEALLEDSHLQREGWIDAGAVRQQLLECRRSGTPARLVHWYVVVLESWLRSDGGR